MVIDLVHPIFKMHLISVLVKDQVECVIPIECVAHGLTLSLSNDIFGLACVMSIGTFFQNPNAPLCGAIGVGKVLIQSALIACPRALHVNGETLDHSSFAVLEHAMCDDLAVEKSGQIERGFFMLIKSYLLLCAPQKAKGDQKAKRQAQKALWTGEMKVKHGMDRLEGLAKKNGDSKVFGEQKLCSMCQRKLHDIDVRCIKTGFAIREVELPNAHESFVKTQFHDVVLLVHELGAPTPTGFCIVFSKCHSINDF
jgi:hypothetical protein